LIELVKMPAEHLASLELFPPPPVHSIVPYSAPNLPVLQMKKLLILRKRILLMQRELLAKSANDCPVSSVRGNGDSYSCTLSSPLTGFEVNWLFDDACLMRIESCLSGMYKIMFRGFCSSFKSRSYKDHSNKVPALNIKLSEFLQARNWQVGNALKLLIEGIQFRRKYKPERIRPKDIQKISRGQVFRKGFDVHGYPIIFIRCIKMTGQKTEHAPFYRPSLSHPADDPDLALKLLLYILERASQSLDRCQGICKFSFVIDYNGYTTANQPPLNLSLKFLDIFQNYYPETLEVAFFLDTPWYFLFAAFNVKVCSLKQRKCWKNPLTLECTFWNVLSPFIPAQTAMKLKFLSTASEEEMRTLHAVIPPAVLDPNLLHEKYNGTYDHKAYWTAENQQFEGFMKFLQHQFIEKNQMERLDGIAREETISRASNTTNSTPTMGSTGENTNQEDIVHIAEADGEIEISCEGSKDAEEKRLALRKALEEQELLTE
ncbi:CRAL/TRIO domain-containing protein, partial [Cardiosporidium cionae]